MARSKSRNTISLASLFLITFLLNFAANAVTRSDSAVYSGGVSANNFVPGFSSIVDSGGATTLTSASVQDWYFTGTQNQSVQMPVVSTLQLGQQYSITNQSSGTVTVQSSGGSTIQSMAPGTNLSITDISLTGTTASSWNANYYAASSGSVSSVGLSVPAFLSVSGSPVTTSGTLAVGLSGTALPVANGGTGQTSILSAFQSFYESVATTLGDLIYGGASGVPTRLPGSISSTPKMLVQTGTGSVSAAPGWQTDGNFISNLNASNVGTGTLSIANGGTGQVTALAAFDALSPLTSAGDVLTYGSGHNQRIGTSAGQLGYFLTSGGAIVADTWSNDGEYLTNVNAVKIQSVGVSSTSPSDKQIFIFNGTSAQWVPKSVSQDAVITSSGVVTVQGLQTVSIASTSPTANQILTFNSGTSKWEPRASTALTNPMTTTGDTIYSSDNSGTPAREAIGSTGQVQVVSSSGIPSWMDPKFNNILWNGAFDIWQRGTSVTVANGVSTYQADRWYVKNSLGTNGVITYSQVGGGTVGSIYGAQVKITTAPTAAQANGTELYQTVENPETLAKLYSKTASFTVLVEGMGNVNQIGVQFMYKTTEAKVDTAIGSEQTCTVNTSTFVSCTINGQAIGSSMTTAGVVGIRIRITAVSTGNTYDLNNGFKAEQAMLTVTPQAMPFVRRGGSYVADYRGDLRFYEKSYDLGTAPGTNTGTDTAGAYVMRVGTITSSQGPQRLSVGFGSSKRASASMTGYSTDGTSAKCRDRTNSSNVTSTFVGVGQHGFEIETTPSAATTAIFFECHWTADAEI